MAIRAVVALASLVLVASLAPVYAQDAPAPAAPPPAVYKPGAGVLDPRLIREVTPKYTVGAMREKIQGQVQLEVVIKTDGTVGDVRVTKPLHPELDEQAIVAAKQWLFQPATLRETKQPINYLAMIELSFRIFDGFERALPENTPSLVGPKALTTVQPVYSPEAFKARTQGAVLVEVAVGLNGRVSGARIKQSIDPAGEVVAVEGRALLRTPTLDDEAMRAARQWTFEPATLDGKPVVAITTLTFTFRLPQ